MTSRDDYVAVAKLKYVIVFVVLANATLNQETMEGDTRQKFNYRK